MRRKETIGICKIIHGATSSNLIPAIDGILDTLTSKVNSHTLDTRILIAKSSLVNHLSHKLINDWSKTY